MRRLPLVLALVPALLLVAGGARAQIEPGSNPNEPRYYGPRAPQPEPSAWDRMGLSGIELEIRGGFMFAGSQSPVQAPNLYPGSSAGGQILNGTLSPSPYSYDPLAFSFTLGERFLPMLSAGVFFAWAPAYQVDAGAFAGDAADGTSQLQRSQWQLGVYGRYYLTMLHPRLQPWVELGVGYSSDNASYTRPLGQASNGQPETGNYRLGEQGVAVPVTIGLDWRIAPIITVGPTFGYARVVPLKGCVEVDVDSFSPVPGQNTCDSSVVHASGYGVFFGGIALKVTVGLPAR